MRPEYSLTTCRTKRSNIRGRSADGMPGPESVTTTTARVRCRAQRHADPPAVRRMLECIVQQIEQQTSQQRRIAIDRDGTSSPGD